MRGDYRWEISTGADQRVRDLVRMHCFDDCDECGLCFIIYTREIKASDLSERIGIQILFSMRGGEKKMLFSIIKFAYVYVVYGFDACNVIFLLIYVKGKPCTRRLTLV